MRIPLALAICLSLTACGARSELGSTSPAASPRSTPAAPTNTPQATPVAMPAAGVPAYVRARVTESAPVVLPATAALPPGLVAEVVARPDSFAVSYTDGRGVRIALAIMVANPPPLTKQGTSRTLPFRGDDRALAVIYDAGAALGDRFLMWYEPATRVAVTREYDTRRGALPYFLSSTGIDDGTFWRIANSLGGS